MSNIEFEVTRLFENHKAITLYQRPLPNTNVHWPFPSRLLNKPEENSHRAAFLPRCLEAMSLVHWNYFVFCVLGQSPIWPLWIFWNQSTVSLFGILHVFHLPVSLTLTEKKKGELLPQCSFSKGPGPAGTAAAVHPRSTWPSCPPAPGTRPWPR